MPRRPHLRLAIRYTISTASSPVIVPISLFARASYDWRSKYHPAPSDRQLPTAPEPRRPSRASNSHANIRTTKSVQSQLWGDPDVRRRPWPRFLRRSSQIRRAKRSPQQVCRSIELRVSSMASDRPMATIAARQSSAGEHGTLSLFGYKRSIRSRYCSLCFSGCSI